MRAPPLLSDKKIPASLEEHQRFSLVLRSTSVNPDGALALRIVEKRLVATMLVEARQEVSRLLLQQVSINPNLPYPLVLRVEDTRLDLPVTPQLREMYVGGSFGPGQRLVFTLHDFPHSSGAVEIDLVSQNFTKALNQVYKMYPEGLNPRLARIRLVADHELRRVDLTCVPGLASKVEVDSSPEVPPVVPVPATVATPPPPGRFSGLEID